MTLYKKILISITMMLAFFTLINFNKDVNAKTPTTTAKAPTVSNMKVTNITSSGYTVTCNFTAEAGVREAYMPTWTVNKGQDDLIWHKATIKGNTLTYQVNIKDHKNETGKYYTHIYLYDKQGRVAKITNTLTINVPNAKAPTVSNMKVTNITSSGYTVTCNFTAAAGLEAVYMPTWTEKNGQDDLIWHKATIKGNTATFNVKTSEHKKETGTYYTHIYVRDILGRQVMTASQGTIKVPGEKLQIVSAVVSDVTTEGYKVECKFTTDTGIKKIQMPTWSTANGQDDIIWYEPKINGNTATLTVKTSNHKGDLYEYATHIYIYDNNNNVAKKELTVKVTKWQWAKCFDASQYCKNNSVYCRNLTVDQISDKVISFGKKQIGKIYTSELSKRLGPNQFDCSGYISYVYSNAFGNGKGINIGTDTLGMKSNLSRYSKPLSNMKKGDLLLATNGYPDGDSRQERHVAIYLGNNQILHCGSSTKGVTISDLNYLDQL